MAKYLHQTYVRSTPDFRQTMKSKSSKHRQQTCERLMKYLHQIYVRVVQDLSTNLSTDFVRPINRLCKTFHYNNYERSFANLQQTCEDMVRPQNEKW